MRLHEVVNNEYPNGNFDLPLPESINISKLGHGGAVTTDTCNSAQKTRRILVDNVGGRVHEMDCMHHLRNVWLNGVAKAVNSYLKDFLEESLDNIASFLRVSPDLAQVTRAFHK